MRLLIFTQKINQNDTTLGFFCDWIKSFAEKADSITIICLEKGEFNFPNNVTVYSLGKEGQVSKFVYLKNLYHYLFLIRGSYDKVFVHMNEEYVLLVGLYWKIKNIPLFFWRNHPKGSIKTRLAVALSTKVFCTSADSFTAKFKKTVIMPAGINTAIFKPVDGVVRRKYSVCVVGRISPIKRIGRALEAINGLVQSGVQISLNIVGSPLKKDMKYYDSLKNYVYANDLSNSVSFVEAVSPDKLPEIYSSHEVCLNLTESGSFDKTIVEAAACGAIPLISNKSLSHLLPEVCITPDSVEEIGQSLQKLLEARVQVAIQKELRVFVNSQDLKSLTEKLFKEIQ